MLLRLESNCVMAINFLLQKENVKKRNLMIRRVFIGFFLLWTFVCDGKKLGREKIEENSIQPCHNITSLSLNSVPLTEML